MRVVQDLSMLATLGLAILDSVSAASSACSGKPASASSRASTAKSSVSRAATSTTIPLSVYCSRTPSDRVCSRSIARSGTVGSYSCTITKTTTRSSYTYVYTTITASSRLAGTSTIISTVQAPPTTVISTLTPPSLIGATYTSTIQTTPGFIPIQDSLPQLKYVNNLGGPNPVAAPAKRRRDASATAITGSASRSAPGISAGCKTTTKTIVPSGLITSRITVNKYLYNATVTTTQTLSPATVTSVSTITAPLTTTAVYAACATNNFADEYIFANGSTLPIGAASGSPLILSTDVGTAYECCVYALGQRAGAWYFVPGMGHCVWTAPALALLADAPVVTTCLPQTDRRAGLYAVLRSDPALQVVAGNGQCGQVTTIVYYP